MQTKINKPISGLDIKKWLPNATIIKYSELKKYGKLPKLPIVLLYEIMPQYGHWVTILKTPEGIEFFDSYGNIVDDQFSFIPEEFRNKTNQDYKYLMHYLYDSKEQINYNNYKFQGNPPIATCGRWSILRNLFNYLTTDQFKDMIIKTAKELNVTTDDLVSLAI